jgi:hypothetical protein
MSNVLQSARPVPSPRTTSSPHPDSLLAAVSYSLLLLEAVCVDVSGGVYCKPTGLDWLCCSPGSCPKHWFPNCCESKAPMTVAQIAERVLFRGKSSIVEEIQFFVKVYAAASLGPAASAYSMPCSASCGYFIFPKASRVSVCGRLPNTHLSP